MTFPTTPILDNFNRANEGPPPSANWDSNAAWFSAGCALETFSNTCRQAQSGFIGGAFYKTLMPADQEAYLTITAIQSSGGKVSGFGLYLRANSADSAITDLYEFLASSYTPGTATFEINRYNSGTGWADLGVIDLGFNLAVGDKIGCRCRGSMLEFFHCPAATGIWQVVVTAIDGNLPGAGYLGVEIFDVIGPSQIAAFDNFGGGILPPPVGGAGQDGGLPRIKNCRLVQASGAGATNIGVLVETSTEAILQDSYFIGDAYSIKAESGAVAHVGRCLYDTTLTSGTIEPIDGDTPSTIPPSHINLVDGHLLIGQVSGKAADKAASGAFTIDHDGVATLAVAPIPLSYLDTDVTLAADSDTKVASQHATRAFVLARTVGMTTYQGTWNANTNSPALASGAGTQGFYYKVSVAGATTIDGVSEWNIGDMLIFNGTIWDKIDNTEEDATASVKGRIQLAGVLAGTAASPSIANNAITNAMLAQIATATIKGRTTAAAGNVEDLSVAQVQTLLGLGSAAYVATSAFDPAGAAAARQAAYANLTTIGALANGAGWLHNDGGGAFTYSTPTIGAGTVTPAMLQDASAQYHVLVSGATPFAYAESGFMLDGTSGGKTSFNVTSGKTLGLTATDDFTLTVPGTGTAALGAGTLTVSTTNDVTGATHTHAITASSDVSAGTSALLKSASGALTLKTLAVSSNLASNLGLSRRLNFGNTMLAFNLRGNDGDDTYRTVVTNAGAGYSAYQIGAGGTHVFFGDIGATVADASITPVTLAVIMQTAYGGGLGVGAYPVATEKLTLSSDYPNYTRLGLYNTVANSGNRNWAIALNSDAYGQFFIASSTSAGGAPTATRLLIDNAGNVGIGTTLSGAYPTYQKLNVLGGILLTGNSSTPSEESLWQIVPALGGTGTHADYTSNSVVKAGSSAGLLEVMQFGNNKTAAMLGVLGAAAIARPAAMTTQLTTLTCSAPGTPDYAIADPVQNTGYGFSTADEFLSLVKAVANQQTRLAELETNLGHTSGFGFLTK